jgi:hypothetical protein
MLETERALFREMPETEQVQSDGAARLREMLEIEQALFGELIER